MAEPALSRTDLDAAGPAVRLRAVTKTYDNGVKVVPSYLLTPISVDKNNYEKELVETGYIKAEDLK